MGIPALPVEPPQADPPELSEAEQRRGRRLAIASHPFSMTYRTAISGDLATQGLVTLGASEALIGIQAAVSPFAMLGQLPALVLVGRYGKRSLLLWSQAVAALAGLPLLFYGDLGSCGAWAPVLMLLSLSATAVALGVGSAGWWPILRGFVSPGETGRFFASLRTLWHLALIAYFFGSLLWLSYYPGSFGLLFGVAWLGGLVRIVLLPFFPERQEAEPPRVWDSVRRVAAKGPLRSYLLGVSLDNAVFRCVTAFAIVLLRRELGLAESETLVTTLAIYTGGMLALYPAGRLVDRFGPGRVLVLTSLLRASAVAVLIGVALTGAPGREVLIAAAALFFVYAFGAQAFGVAEIKILFALVGDRSPAGSIVATVVARGVLTGVVAFLAGLGLDALLDAQLPPRSVYAGLFGLLALGQVAVLIPLGGLLRQDVPGLN